MWFVVNPSYINLYHFFFLTLIRTKILNVKKKDWKLINFILICILLSVFFSLYSLYSFFYVNFHFGLFSSLLFCYFFYYHYMLWLSGLVQLNISLLENGKEIEKEK